MAGQHEASLTHCADLVSGTVIDPHDQTFVVEPRMPTDAIGTLRMRPERQRPALRQGIIAVGQSSIRRQPSQARPGEVHEPNHRRQMDLSEAILHEGRLTNKLDAQLPPERLHEGASGRIARVQNAVLIGRTREAPLGTPAEIEGLVLVCDWVQAVPGRVSPDGSDWERSLGEIQWRFGVGTGEWRRLRRRHVAHSRAQPGPRQRRPRGVAVPAASYPEAVDRRLGRTRPASTDR